MNEKYCHFVKECDDCNNGIYTKVKSHIMLDGSLMHSYSYLKCLDHKDHSHAEDKYNQATVLFGVDVVSVKRE